MSSPLIYSIKCANCGYKNSILKFGLSHSDYYDLDGRANGGRDYSIPEHCTNCNYVSININKIERQEAIIVNSSTYQAIFDYNKQYSCPTSKRLQGRALILDSLGGKFEKSQNLVYLCWEYESNNQPLADYYRGKAVESINNFYTETNALSPNDIWWINNFLLDSYRRLGRFTDADRHLENIRLGMQKESEHLTLLEFQEFAVARRDSRNYRKGVLLADWWKDNKNL